MEGPDADQLLLTRFNVARQAGSGLGVDPAWLDGRLALFERVCAPSVRAQHGPRRPWLVFVDARTPDAALARIEAAAGPAGGVLVPVAGLLPVERLQQLVEDAVPLQHRVLLTTRLDNDDALAAGHLDAVLRAADPDRQEFLNPTSGYQLAGSRAYATSDPSGPFLTLVEHRRPGRPPLTAFCTPHRAARRTAPVRQVGQGRLWVQLLHGQNLVNAVTGVRVDNAALAHDFPHLAPGLAADSRDGAYRLDRARSLVRASLTRGRRGVLALAAR